MISLYDLLEAANGQLFGEPAAQIFADFSFDSRLPQDSHLFIALKTERGDGHQYLQEAVRNGATGILCTTPPTFDTDNISVILVKDTAAALSAWTQFILKKLGTRVIAITGTSGKSVTGEAIRRVLGSYYKVYHRPGNYSGALSLPVSLAKLSQEHDFAVLELDITHPGEMSSLLQTAAPEVGVVTHIAYADAKNFENQEQIAQEHNQLLAHLPAEGLAVLNYDDELARGMAGMTHASVLTVGVDTFGADLMGYNVVLTSNGTGFDLRHGQNRYVGRWIPLLGKHQLYSALRAVAVALYYNIPAEDSLKILKEMSPLPGRMKPLTGPNGSALIDDSYSADPDTMRMALEWLKAVSQDHRRTVFIMGDIGDLGIHTQRGHRLVGQEAAQVAHVFITEGSDAALAGRAAIDVGMDPRHVWITYSASDIVGRLKGDGGLTSDDLVLIKGGADSRMERVVKALLANPADSAQLTRQDLLHEAVAFAAPTRPSSVDVDLDALASNVRQLKSLIGPNVMLNAAVKADAYGSGAVAVARTALLNGAGYLAVASIDEALELRDAGIEAPILMMSYVPPGAIRQAIRYNLTVTLYDIDLTRVYDRTARETGSRLRAHVKIDSGMGRLGVPPDRSMAFFRQLLGFKNLEIEGIYTHFSSADENPGYTAEQARVFEAVLKPLKASGFDFRYIHAANSAATLAYPQYHFNMVRVGLAMHGLSPSPTVQVPSTFQPVLSWKTQIIQVKTLPPDHAVGYANTYVTEGEETIAVIPVGYADGFRRAPGSWQYVLVHGQIAPVVGRISMEKTTLNVTDIPDVSIGDEVVLLGSQGTEAITADQIAEWLGTSSYEVLTTILPRVPRR